MPSVVEVQRMQDKLADWPQLAHYREANAKLPAVERGRVVFLGDSITESWARETKFFEGNPHVGRGVSGQTTAQMLVRFRQDVIDLHPSVVVILAGVNDIAGNTGPTTLKMIEDNLRSMTELARASRIPVVLSSVLPADEIPWHKGLDPAPKIKALNDWITAYCAGGNATFVNYYAEMATPEGGMKPGLSVDGVHPTAAGFAVMGPLVQAGIAKATKSIEP